jgi:uncharacterized protein
MNLIQELENAGKITPPKWLANSVIYLARVGSMAYGVSTNNSDEDVYGICIPPLDVLFPHLAGEIPGFGTPKKRFEQYQQEHVLHKGKNYDIAIFNIVKYFTLTMNGNPNMVDRLFVPEHCVLYSTIAGQCIRERRKMFLNKRTWHTFKGYAYAQKNDIFKTNRPLLVEKYGYDTKAAYHVVRLLLEVEMILTEGGLDLQRHCHMLKAIREGEWTADQVQEFFSTKEKALETAYIESKLPYAVSDVELRIKKLLMTCLEMTYGDLSHAVVLPGREREALLQVLQVVTDALYGSKGE